MEKYINEDTSVKNDVYDLFKENIKCSICSHLMIEPVICLSCQNSFCKKCIQDWKAKNGSCPKNCEICMINDVIGKNNFITKFKFKCIKGCGEEIPFDNINNHYSSDCLNKKKLKSIKTLTSKEAAEYRIKENTEIPHLTSMYKKLIYFIYSNNLRYY